MDEVGFNNGPLLLTVDDALLREFIELLPGNDIRAVFFSCKRLRDIISSPPYSRAVLPPSIYHIMSSLALLTWAYNSGWPWPRLIVNNRR